jgi:hypothetical protein
MIAAEAAMSRNRARALAIVTLLAVGLLRPSSVWAGLLVHGKGLAFSVEEPAKWKGETESASRWNADVIFYKQGTSPSDSASVVIRVGIFPKKDEATWKDLEADMNEYRIMYPKVAFKDLDGIKSRYKVWPKLFYMPGTFFEYVTFLNPGPEHHQVVSISMNKSDTPATADELSAYQTVIQSFVLVPE